MFSNKSGLTLRIGFLLVAFAWFSFSFYEFTIAVLHGANPGPQVSAWLLTSDTAATLGLGFRAAGGFAAVVTALFYVLKRDLALSETLMALRMIVAFEGVYWFSLFFSIIPEAWTHLTVMTLENNLPCTIESTLLPIVLGVLFLKLSPKKVSTDGVKWGLIAGTAYIFVFWLNNTANWIAALTYKGIDYLVLYPANLFSFTITSVGLLALALFMAYYSKKIIGKRDYANLNLRKLGIIVTCFGLYFDILFVLYIFLGPVGGWGLWYAWFFGHNMDLWLMALPLAGLPLLLVNKENSVFLKENK